MRNVPRRKRKGLKEEMKDEERRTGEGWSENPKTGHAQPQGRQQFSFVLEFKEASRGGNI